MSWEEWGRVAQELEATKPPAAIPETLRALVTRQRVAWVAATGVVVLAGWWAMVVAITQISAAMGPVTYTPTDPMVQMVSPGPHCSPGLRLIDGVCTTSTHAGPMVGNRP